MLKVEMQRTKKVNQPAVSPDTSPAPVKRTIFYGIVDLDPLLAKARFNDIFDEIVQRFTCIL